MWSDTAATANSTELCGSPPALVYLVGVLMMITWPPVLACYAFRDLRLIIWVTALSYLSGMFPIVLGPVMPAPWASRIPC